MIEITTNPKDIGCFTESDLYEETGSAWENFSREEYGTFCMSDDELIEMLTARGYAVIPKDKTALEHFLSEEVPFRFLEMFNMDGNQITAELIAEGVQRLFNHSDEIFDYDRIDAHLEDICKENGIAIGGAA